MKKSDIKSFVVDSLLFEASDCWIDSTGDEITEGTRFILRIKGNFIQKYQIYLITEHPDRPGYFMAFGELDLH